MRFLDRYPNVGHWWWSENKPESYVVDRVGLGTVAYLSYAMFNVTYALCRKLETHDDHVRAKVFFHNGVKHLEQDFYGLSLADRILLLPKQEFLAWALEHEAELNPTARVFFMKVRENDSVIRGV